MTYNNYVELAAEHELNVDYEIVWNLVDLRLAFYGIHGGSIEPGSDEMVRALAGEQVEGPRYSSYRFRGIMPSGNTALHITSTSFDEPQALRLLEQVQTIVAIHRMTASTPIIWVGGLDLFLRDRIIDALNAADFDAAIPPNGDLAGSDPDNICNRGLTSEGVQIEFGNLVLSDPDMFGTNTAAGRWDSRNHGFYRAVRAIRAAVDLTDYYKAQ